MRPLFVLLLAAVLSAGAVNGIAQTDFETEITASRTKLEELRKQAEAKRRAVRKYANQEKGVLEQLKEAEEALRATRRYIEGLEERQGKVEAEIRDTRASLEQARAVLGERRTVLNARLRHTYMYGKVRSLEILFSADSFPQILRRGTLLRRLLDQDKKLVAEVEERQSGVKERLSWLQLNKDELAALLSERGKEEEAHAALKEERQKNLNWIRSRKAANQRAARELGSAASELENVLADLEQRQEQARLRAGSAATQLDAQDFGRHKGKLPWPAKGKIITRFGRNQHPKYKTVTMSKGIDIAAEIGKPVTVVGRGLVDLVQWLPGYGQTVIVNHGSGFYTIYAHLSTVTVTAGDLVEPGQRVGTVGETGSLIGPCLHFELRAKDSPQDPLQWLK